MAEDFTFPQTFDPDDAEAFASMIGRQNENNYVEEGLDFTVDYAVPEVTVNTGKAFIQTSSSTASTSGKTILNTNYVVQITSKTVALTDSAVNYVYLEANLGTDDSASVNAYTSQQSGEEQLLLGTIDTTNDTSELSNRNPTAVFEDITANGTIDGVVQSSSLISDTSMSIDIDNDNNSTTESLTITQDSGASDILRVNEGGNIEVPNGNVGINGASVDRVLKLQADTNASEQVFTMTDSSDTAEAISFGLNSAGGGDLEIRDDSNTIQISFDASTGSVLGGGSVQVPDGDITDGTNVIYDQSASEIPDSAMGTIANSTLANSSITVAGNTISLGGSTGIALGDLSNVTASGEGSGGGFNADQVDGYHASELFDPKNIAVLTSTNTTLDINQTSWTAIPWDSQLQVDAGYTHDPSGSPEQITFDNAGTYRVEAMLTYDGNGNARVNPGMKISINGTRRSALGLSGYVRSASGHGEASNYIEETFSVNAGDTLRIETLEYGNNGTVNLRSTESQLSIEQIDQTVTQSGDSDTVDGKHAADFVLEAGDTMTGALNTTSGLVIPVGTDEYV